MYVDIVISNAFNLNKHFFFFLFLFLFTNYLSRYKNCICKTLFIYIYTYFLGGSFLNSCGCSTAKSKTPPQETFFYPLNGTEHGSQPPLTTRDGEPLVIEKCKHFYGNIEAIPKICIQDKCDC